MRHIYNIFLEKLGGQIAGFSRSFSMSRYAGLIPGYITGPSADEGRENLYCPHNCNGNLWVEVWTREDSYEN